MLLINKIFLVYFHYKLLEVFLGEENNLISKEKLRPMKDFGKGCDGCENY